MTQPATQPTGPQVDSIPIEVNGKVLWITPRQIVSRMRDDFEDRHAISEEGDDEFS